MAKCGIMGEINLTLKIMKKLLFAFPIVVLLAVGCSSSKPTSFLPTQNQSTAQQQQTITADATLNWKTYSNSKYSYQVGYPANLNLGKYIAGTKQLN